MELFVRYSQNLVKAFRSYFDTIPDVPALCCADSQNFADFFFISTLISSMSVRFFSGGHVQNYLMFTPNFIRASSALPSERHDLHPVKDFYLASGKECIFSGCLAITSRRVNEWVARCCATTSNYIVPSAARLLFECLLAWSSLSVSWTRWDQHTSTGLSQLILRELCTMQIHPAS